MDTRLYDVEARIAGLYPIAGIGDPEYPPEWVGEFCEWVEGPASGVFSALQELARFDEDEDYPAPSDVCEAWINAGRTGAVMLVEWCVRHYAGRGGVFTSGWGHTRFLYVYVPDGVDYVGIAVAIAEHHHQRARSEATEG
mgnify:CR=1 FL=1